MRRLSALAAALVVGFAATSAQALILPVDDFSAPVLVLFDPTGGAGGAVSSGPVSGGGFTRTITHELLAPSVAGSCVNSCVEIGANTFPPGSLVMSNRPLFDSEVTVSWTLAAGYVPLTSPVSFFFDIIDSDGNAKQGDLFINNVFVANFVIPSNATNLNAAYGLSLAQQTTLNAGGLLTLKFNGTEGWDMVVDTVGFSIPEPTTLALAGLALLGAGVASRRRKA